MLLKTRVNDELTDDPRKFLMLDEDESDDGEDEEDDPDASGSIEEEEDPTEWMRSEGPDDEHSGS